MTCPACGEQLRQVGTGMGCDSCGLFMGPGGGGDDGGRVGLAHTLGWYRDQLPKMTLPPNPLLPETLTIEKGDRVGFKLHYGVDAGQVLVGVVENVETNRLTGEVKVTLDQDTVTSLED